MQEIVTTIYLFVSVLSLLTGLTICYLDRQNKKHNYVTLDNKEIVVMTILFAFIPLLQVAQIYFALIGIYEHNNKRKEWKEQQKKS
jgi:uncharacterized membrane protein